jgi:hypothetical protein
MRDGLEGRLINERPNAQTCYIIRTFNIHIYYEQLKTNKPNILWAEILSEGSNFLKFEELSCEKAAAQKLIN